MPLSVIHWLWASNSFSNSQSLSLSLFLSWSPKPLLQVLALLADCHRNIFRLFAGVSRGFGWEAKPGCFADPPLINHRVKYTGLLCLGCVGLLALCDLWQIVGDLATDKVSDCQGWHNIGYNLKDSCCTKSFFTGLF